jgi:hypothetical protein
VNKTDGTLKCGSFLEERHYVLISGETTGEDVIEIIIIIIVVEVASAAPATVF